MTLDLCHLLPPGYGLDDSAPAPFDLTNLVAYWKLSDTSDSFGANTLSSNGGVTFGSGKLGNCATFTDGDVLSISDNAALSMGTNQAFHADGWIMHEIEGDNHVIFIKGDSFSAVSYEYGLRINTSDQIVCDTSNGTSDKDFVGSALGALTVSTWNYFAYWHDPVADVVGLRLNENEATSAWNGGCQDSSFAFRFGGAAGTLKGKVDDVAIYKDIRSTEFRDARYNAGNGRELF